MDQPEWIQALFTWIEANPSWTGILIFLFAFAESILLVGIIIPGAAFLLALGTLVGLGGLDLYTAWLWSSLGGFLGDGISFWIGWRYKQNLLKMWPMYKFPDLIDKGQQFFKKYGGVSIFIGRFVGPVRPVIPAIGGMMNMSVKKYVIISIVASILWAPFYLLPGILFGSAIDKMAQIAGKMSILLIVLTGLIWLVYWLISRLYLLVVPRAYRLMSNALAWTQKHPLLGKITAGLVDPRQPEKGSLAMLASFIIVFSILMIVVLAANETILNWSRASEHFFYAFHNPWTIQPMKLLLFIGHDWVTLILTLTVAGWLYYRRLHLVMNHWLLVSASSYVLSLVICWFGHQHIHWFGEHHLVWFTAVITWWAVLVAGAYPVKWRSWPYVLAGICVLLTGFAALFFFTLDLSLVFVSILSGSLWSMLVGIAFRTHSRKQFVGFPFKLILFLVLLSGMILSWILHGHSLNDRKPSASEISYPRATEQTDGLFTRRVPLNVQFSGNQEALQQVLYNSGWTGKQVRTWGGFYEAMLAKEDSDDLPIISMVHKGDIETLILYKPLSDTNIEVLHLWPGETPNTWVGALLQHQRYQALYMLNYWRIDQPVPIADSLLLRDLSKSGEWQLDTQENVLQVR
ncbi:DedA family protein [Marinicella sp. W31]|uniref:DedA family protein n=1 Tax=Marinicella sp. W31 TaxID=3023713 RepID=UPI003757857F